MGVSVEVEEAAFDYTDGSNLSFAREVIKNLDDEVVIEYLEDRFPDKSFTDEEIKEMKELIVDYARGHIATILLELEAQFKNELNSMLTYYIDEREMDPIAICKILTGTTHNLLPNL